MMQSQPLTTLFSIGAVVSGGELSFVVFLILYKFTGGSNLAVAVTSNFEIPHFPLQTHFPTYQYIPVITRALTHAAPALMAEKCCWAENEQQGLQLPIWNHSLCLALAMWKCSELAITRELNKCLNVAGDHKKKLNFLISGQLVQCFAINLLLYKTITNMLEPLTHCFIKAMRQTLFLANIGL